ARHQGRRRGRLPRRGHASGARADARLPRSRGLADGAGGKAQHRVGRRASPNEEHPGVRAAVSAFVDTNILVRHLTGDPPAMAARATAYLREEPELLLTDLIVAETVYVLE